MQRLAPITLALALSVSAAGCAQDLGLGLPAADDAADDAAHAADIQTIKRDVAREVAGLLADPAFADALAHRFDAGADSVRLADALAALPPTGAALRLSALDHRVRTIKGIAAYTSDLLEVRLIRPDGAALAAADLDWTSLPVALSPAGDEDAWTAIEAFTARGDTLTLDPRVAPDEPVLVAGIDAREDLRAGIAYINDALIAHGLLTPTKLDPAAVTTETSRLDYIRLANDQEPWLSGAAEIYALVSGVDFDSDHVRLEAVDMPYLDHDGTDYYPNQILIFWEPYRFAAANVQLFEHDDNTNYQTLVQALISAVEAVLDLTAPQYAIIATIANQIVAAMPSHWFSNDDDYVDSFYTLEKTTTYTSYTGAAGNAKVTLTPYILQGN